jgi:cytochrome b561
MTQLRNTTSSYGAITISIHWLMAVIILALYAVGWYMVGLNYTSPYYQTLPFVHKSVGLIIFGLLLFRVFWRLTNPKPVSLANHTKFEKVVSHYTHILLYFIIFLTLISGYLISTADGRPVTVFNWFSVPALPFAIENQEDKAGFAHFWIATALVSLAGAHALAALKHHFVDKDETLTRLLSTTSSSKKSTENS